MLLSLGQKQRLFAKYFAYLIIEAIRRGYETTIGEVHRPPETAKIYAEDGRGISNSLHTLKLAGDLFLFKNGLYLRKSEDYKIIGEFWEGLSGADLKFCWGGSFDNPDGNHFSVFHEGRK